MSSSTGRSGMGRALLLAVPVAMALFWFVGGTLSAPPAEEADAKPIEGGIQMLQSLLWVLAFVAAVVTGFVILYVTRWRSRPQPRTERLR